MQKEQTSAMTVNNSNFQTEKSNVNSGMPIENVIAGTLLIQDNSETQVTPPCVIEIHKFKCK